MHKFDLDADGSISFYEFVRMLCCKPWGLLLPEAPRCSRCYPYPYTPTVITSSCVAL